MAENFFDQIAEPQLVAQQAMQQSATEQYTGQKQESVSQPQVNPTEGFKFPPEGQPQPKSVIDAQPAEPIAEQPSEVIPEHTSVEPIPDRPSSKHFKTLKAEKEQAQRERDELMRMLQEERSRGVQPKQEEDDFGIDENNYIEGKDLKKVVKELKELRKDITQYKQKTAIEVTEARLKAEIPDYQKILSDENVEILKDNYPEIAETIFNSQADPFKVAKAACNMITKLGIHVEDKHTAKREVVQANLAKPRASTTVAPRQGQSPLSQANEYGSDTLTEERMAALRREVDMYRNGN